MPLIPALGKQRQVVLCEFQASLVYIVSSAPGQLVRPYFKKTKKKKVTTNKKIGGREQ